MSQKLINTSHPMGGREKKNNKLFSAVDFFRLDQTQKKKEKTVCGVKTVNLFSDTFYHTLGRLVIVSLD